jgi:hypothetical protein
MSCWVSMMIASTPPSIGPFLLEEDPLERVKVMFPSAGSGGTGHPGRPDRPGKRGWSGVAALRGAAREIARGSSLWVRWPTPYSSSLRRDEPKVFVSTTSQPTPK